MAFCSEVCRAMTRRGVRLAISQHVRLRVRQVQQLGRTHRSNQVQPPKYLIVSSDISGEQRFASAVAKRLEQLGALTHGDRHASSASDALSSSNLQTKCGPSKKYV